MFSDWYAVENRLHRKTYPRMFGDQKHACLATKARMFGDQRRYKSLFSMQNPASLYLLYPLYYLPVVSYRLAVDLPRLLDNPTG